MGRNFGAISYVLLAKHILDIEDTYGWWDCCCHTASDLCCCFSVLLMTTCLWWVEFWGTLLKFLTMESLAQLEALCEKLYNSLDSTERAHAESTLNCFSVGTECISHCQYILENALTPYALMLASSSLLKQVTEQRLPLQLRLDIRNILACLLIALPINDVAGNLYDWLQEFLSLFDMKYYFNIISFCFLFVQGNYLVTYLATRGPDLQPFVVRSLIQLFCRVTKFGWLEDDGFKEVLKEALNFLSQGPCHYAIGLKILNQLVSEMNEPNPGLPASYQRKIACSFKDQSLFKIFEISLTSLCQLKDDVGSKLQELALSLSFKCLSFNFMGTSSDESYDEIGIVQVCF
ncbi:hypothetical protein Pint_18409 [Pistacia integerrima]|uniref:Uncharacterized protein n=1 Tax=Pistacia integerrima TaxID=434235 RepID=A0ACC0Z0U8_9ROSI|nr:hypothetical protein Pint_18409 [Pistacia integerrima]